MLPSFDVLVKRTATRTSTATEQSTSDTPDCSGSGDSSTTPVNLAPAAATHHQQQQQQQRLSQSPHRHHTGAQQFVSDAAPRSAGLAMPSSSSSAAAVNIGNSNSSSSSSSSSSTTPPNTGLPRQPSLRSIAASRNSCSVLRQSPPLFTSSSNSISAQPASSANTSDDQHQHQHQHQHQQQHHQAALASKVGSPPLSEFAAMHIPPLTPGIAPSTSNSDHLSATNTAFTDLSSSVSANGSIHQRRMAPNMRLSLSISESLPSPSSMSFAAAPGSSSLRHPYSAVGSIMTPVRPTMVNGGGSGQSSLATPRLPLPLPITPITVMPYASHPSATLPRPSTGSKRTISGMVATGSPASLATMASIAQSPSYQGVSSNISGNNNGQQQMLTPSSISSVTASVVAAVDFANGANASHESIPELGMATTTSSLPLRARRGSLGPIAVDASLAAPGNHGVSLEPAPRTSTASIAPNPSLDQAPASAGLPHPSRVTAVQVFTSNTSSWNDISAAQSLMSLAENPASATSSNQSDHLAAEPVTDLSEAPSKRRKSVSGLQITTSYTADPNAPALPQHPSTFYQQLAQHPQVHSGGLERSLSRTSGMASALLPYGAVMKDSPRVAPTYSHNSVTTPVSALHTPTYHFNRLTLEGSNTNMYNSGVGSFYNGPHPLAAKAATPTTATAGSGVGYGFAGTDVYNRPGVTSESPLSATPTSSVPAYQFGSNDPHQQLPMLGPTRHGSLRSIRTITSLHKTTLASSTTPAPTCAPDDLLPNDSVPMLGSMSVSEQTQQSSDGTPTPEDTKAQQSKASRAPVKRSTDDPNRKYICSVPGCGSRFNRSEHLKRHESTHSGQRPFECDICHRFFSRYDNMKQHREIHTAGRGRRNTSSESKKSRKTHQLGTEPPLSAQLPGDQMQHHQQSISQAMSSASTSTSAVNPPRTHMRTRSRSLPPQPQLLAQYSSSPSPHLSTTSAATATNSTNTVAATPTDMYISHHHHYPPLSTTTTATANNNTSTNTTAALSPLSSLPYPHSHSHNQPQF
ncbi:hypothetical protein GQ42DRAFT_162117 [Ramicandelaber brevisporus]|nr:hypothetical protein GQ42DRAFT_162117 [Ramicandelaber brevisporus]